MKTLFNLICIIVLGCSHLDAFAQTDKPTLRVGLITDIQYADADTKGVRFYRNSLKKLEESLHFFNKEEVKFTVHLGDYIDKGINSFDSVSRVFKIAQQKVYNTTGNHDYMPELENKLLFKKLNMPAEYYSFTKKGWRFILLNTNELASYANIKGTPKEQEYNHLIQKMKQENRSNIASYNGGISAQQMEWLTQELTKATHKKEKVIILSHHPLAFAKGLSALNDLEIQETLSKFPCVKAVLSGHHHSGDFGYVNDIPYVTLEGILDTEAQNSFGILELYPQQIKILGNGRMTSRTLHFN